MAAILIRINYLLLIYYSRATDSLAFWADAINTRMRLVTGSFAVSPGTLNVHGTIEFKILNHSSAGWSLPWASDCLASSGVVGDVACFQDGFQNTLTSLILSLTRFNSITSLNNLLKSSLDEKNKRLRFWLCYDKISFYPFRLCCIPIILLQWGSIFNSQPFIL